MKRELNSMDLKELKSFIEELGEKPFRAKQIFNYIHKNNCRDIDSITTLSKDFREKLKEKAYINNLKIYGRYDSELDDTKKYLFELEDGNIIESVIMEYKHGSSICVSTQVGCRMGCSFCASTKGGLIRNLTAGEILDQVYRAELDLGKRISNIVLMGSGEPLDNYDNVIKFIRLVTDEEGHNISTRNISLSTCGIVPKMYELAEEKLPITLAISLHSPFDKDRKKIMPITNKYSIEEVIRAAKDYIEITGRRVTFEYTLIEGVNDRDEDLYKLIEHFRGMNIHLNLIPLNPIKEYRENHPSEKNIKSFKYRLEKANINATIRREMGRDISASCGQLRRSVLNE